MRSTKLSVRRSRALLVGVAVAVLAACGSDDEPGGSSSTSTSAGAGLTTTTVPDGVTTSSGVAATSTAATSVTTAAPTTVATPSPTTAAGLPSCGGRAGLTEYLVRFATASSPIDDLKFVISDVAISGARVDWGRGAATPPADSGLDGFVAVAHCEPKDGTIQWVVKDLGTSGIGCTPEVPADLAYDC